MTPRRVIDGFTVIVWVDDHGPAHVHATLDHGRRGVKIFLEPDVTPGRITGLNKYEVSRALRAAKDHRDELITLWKATNDKR